MLKRLLLLLFLLSIQNSVFAQKNRYESFFKELDSMTDNELIFKKLTDFKSGKKLNTAELIEYYQKGISAGIQIQKYDDALKMSNKGLLLSRKMKHDSLTSYFTERIGVVHCYLNQKDKGREYFEKALAIAEKCHCDAMIAKSLRNLGVHYIEHFDNKKAEYYLKKALLYYEKVGKNLDEIGLTNRLLATLYTQTKRYDLAKALYLKVIKTSEELKDTALICSSHAYYARLLDDIGDLKLSIAHLEKALKLARLSKNNNTIMACLDHLCISYTKNKEFEKSNTLYRELYLLDKTIFQENLKKSVAETEVKYKTAEIEREKELAEAKALSERRKTDVYVFVFIGIILTLIIIFLMIYLKQQAKRKKIEQELQKQHVEAVLEAQEEEKVRIARDLHDGICQKFAATKMRFNAISSDLLDSIPEIQQNYKNCISLLDEATNELRNIAHEIMPPSLSELGLAEALRQMTQQTFSQHIQFSFEVFGQQERFGQAEEINMYRITQELYANVIKHANATEVAIQLIFSKKQFSLFVEDNGEGFISKEKLGMGLGNIQLRADLIGAKFNIEPGANGGTFASLIKEKKSKNGNY